MKWAVLDYTNRVVSLVDQDERPDRGIKAYDGAAIGKFWNGSTFEAPRWFTYEFLQRFTDAELDGCLVASQTNAIVRRFLAFAESAPVGGFQGHIPKAPLRQTLHWRENFLASASA